ncbi:hypothetical protein I4F81_004646 [Pyropia yezoensis]|uniref:Uncharacterized protein n=1 Tax=Pyropia yezoensis TaxID=2788 RepID=A0ACC3BWF5_PYRYE|nr:hypothetical protein I4F81_004646 [Neopyropia yezoensis]
MWDSLRPRRSRVPRRGRRGALTCEQSEDAREEEADEEADGEADGDDVEEADEEAVEWADGDDVEEADEEADGNDVEEADEEAVEEADGEADGEADEGADGDDVQEADEEAVEEADGEANGEADEEATGMTSRRPMRRPSRRLTGRPTGRPTRRLTDLPLRLLQYDANPSAMQAVMRAVFRLGASAVTVAGVADVVHVPLYERLDGTRGSKYVDRVELSARGGRVLAEVLAASLPEGGARPRHVRSSGVGG